MAKITYQPGIPALPVKWSGFLSTLLDGIGMPSITISSTYRSIDANSTAMYNNIKTQGVAASMALYNANMKQVVQVFAKMTAAGYGQSDTIAAMSAQTRKLEIPVHSRTQDEKFCVFDVPPAAVPESLRFAFEKTMEKNASKFINPFKQKGDPVYHIEFGGIKASTVLEAGSIIIGILAAIFYILSRR
jgi:hypothetical protein